MAVDSHTGLVRVVLVAPNRRLDLALPEGLTLAAVLPALLSHAGEDVVDEAGDEGGWAVRRADGRLLDVGRTALAHGVRDGEILHLVRARADWPEPDYDDVVEAIAAGARQGGALWDGQVSRRVGTAAAGALIALAIAVCFVVGPEWTPAALLNLAVAAGCLAGAAVLIRLDGEHEDVVFALAGYSLPAAFAGGLLLLGGTDPLREFGAPHLLLGSLALLVAGLIGQLAVPGRRWLSTAATVAGAAAAGWAIVALGPLDGPRSAAIAVAVLLVALPIWPGVAARMGRLPLPAVPRSAEDLVRDSPIPPAAVTFAAVARADVVLTGILSGSSVIAGLGLILLGSARGASAPLLTAVAGAAFLLRARLFPAVRHRLPLLLCGLTGVATLAVTALGRSGGDDLLWSVPALIALAALALGMGVRYHRGRPSVYLARAGELLEVVLLLSVVPLACGVVGLYAAMRGVAG